MWHRDLGRDGSSKKKKAGDGTGFRTMRQTHQRSDHSHILIKRCTDPFISKDQSGIKKRKKIKQIPFNSLEEHKKILTRVIPFRDFIVGRDLLVKKEVK